jgi:16S rRNA (adenine1518-N6/adenine1519-N6)-dimethyltransferase
LVANLPYNVAVPVVLHLLGTFPSIGRVMVMVQREVADRLCAQPGSRTYGVPSVKARWFGDVSYAGDIGRTVFWPAPNVDSGLVSIVRRDGHRSADRGQVFAVIDAAFGQRRKKLRTALSSRFEADIDQAMQRVGLDLDIRGEQLDIDDFVALAGSLADPRT